jgi:hypothetical protein
LVGDLRDVTVDSLHGIEAVMYLAAGSVDPLRAVAGDVADDVDHCAAARLVRDAGVRLRQLPDAGVCDDRMRRHAA